MEYRKTLQELTLLDRFLFAETMEKPENMQAVLEIILGRDLVLKYLPQAEKEQRISSRFRFVKLDVWAQDEEGAVYDTEVQARNTGNLPKRSRYYQALIDSKMLEPGVDNFNDLGPVFIIMIMPFDLFGEKKYRYTFAMQCEEVPGVKLDDGAVRIFLNTRGQDGEDITPELKELLYLIEHTNDRERVFQSEQVRRISESVRTIQNNEEVGVRYMQAWEEILMERREAREETLKEVQHLIDEAEQKQNEAEKKQNEAEQETDRIKREARKLMDEAHDRELDVFLNLLNRGFSVEEAKAITNSREDIVKEALTRQ
ncbi:MAG: Rpn family recombination-promoting nuclease/putative transposase [Clostridiales bacterium]|nr:Rpn family recombination-promoting nuclease/putative transposase [Clostridiales bacterium]